MAEHVNSTHGSSCFSGWSSLSPWSWGARDSGYARGAFRSSTAGGPLERNIIVTLSKINQCFSDQSHIMPATCLLIYTQSLSLSFPLPLFNLHLFHLLHHLQLGLEDLGLPEVANKQDAMRCYSIKKIWQCMGHGWCLIMHRVLLHLWIKLNKEVATALHVTW